MAIAGGAMLAGAQHCMPQPAAQGHPDLSSGAPPLLAALWQRRKSGDGAAPTDNGNNRACSAMT